jgi:hypothetical protein
MIKEHAIIYEFFILKIVFLYYNSFLDKIEKDRGVKT